MAWNIATLATVAGESIQHQGATEDINAGALGTVEENIHNKLGLDSHILDKLNNEVPWHFLSLIKH